MAENSILTSPPLGEAGRGLSPLMEAGRGLSPLMEAGRGLGLHCLLLYYTGTFNTRFVTGKVKARMEAAGWTVTTYELYSGQDPSTSSGTAGSPDFDYSQYDIIGLGCPIYGFAAPYPFLKFVRRQKFPKGTRVFIYKNSGETYHANDASSKYILRKLRHDKCIVENEYHFLMPYNIHFPFEDRIIREMFVYNGRLLEIMMYELEHNIPNLKPYKLWPRLCVTTVARPQYIGGDVNSFLYHVDPDKCTKCDMCIKRCPTHNIYRKENGEMAFHHNCLMCMRCSFFCPSDAFDIGFLEDWGWHVNVKGGYNFKKIAQMPYVPVINDNTKGFFHCYIETFKNIDKRYDEIFGADSHKEITNWSPPTPKGGVF